MAVFTTTLTLISLVYYAYAHVAAWHPAMYCLNGTEPGVDDQNTNSAVSPLFNLSKTDWWFHHVNGCDEFPPDEGVFLELPANDRFAVELAVNRAFTTLSFGGANVGKGLDGKDNTDLGQPVNGQSECITDPNIHAQNETMAAGSAFAISYVSELSAVTPENLVVFSILEHSPWNRVATYDVPNLPACPDAGCICAWGWVPNGCGEPNIYMQGFRCKVTGNTGDAAVASGSPPVWCGDDPSTCIAGAKQMVFWNQAEGDNIEVDGFDNAGNPKFPMYNEQLGWAPGAQHDIFLQSGSATTTPRPTQTPGGLQNQASSLHQGAWMFKYIPGVVSLLTVIGIPLFR
ncbi:hypothetical protein C8J56DRAFT_863127 [Mycena floridula]|nr:hypothetical protein C8J56DRAFT_863127 [Mycena floridula]